MSETANNEPDAYERVNALGLPAWENPETGVLETRPEFVEGAEAPADAPADEEAPAAVPAEAPRVEDDTVRAQQPKRGF